MKVLIISHNVFSHTRNMGKTLLNYFGGFSSSETAQFYIQSEVPTDDKVCVTYYRFTDKDAVRSLVCKRAQGDRPNILTYLSNSRTDNGITRSLYIKGRKRTPCLYILRNMLWRFANWKGNNFKKWLDDVKPDVVFFASGDYAFMYRIAEFVAEYCNAPLVVACVDDYYTINANKDKLLGKWTHKRFLKQVKRTMEKAIAIFTICDSMNETYSKLFRKPCFTLHTSVHPKEMYIDSNPYRISYMGNLGLGRHRQLIDIAHALHELSDKEHQYTLDVYSAEKNPEILTELTRATNLCFHGMISADEVLKVMSESILTIHTESFDKTIMNKIRYSVSTKIADSLMHGPCLLAYGPRGIASVDYLAEHRAAYVITSREDLTSGLREILNNAQLRADTVERARKLAYKNHRTEVNSANLRKWLEEAVASKE